MQKLWPVMWWYYLTHPQHHKQINTEITRAAPERCSSVHPITVRSESTRSSDQHDFTSSWHERELIMSKLARLFLSIFYRFKLNTKYSVNHERKREEEKQMLRFSDIHWFTDSILDTHISLSLTHTTCVTSSHIITVCFISVNTVHINSSWTRTVYISIHQYYILKAFSFITSLYCIMLRTRVSYHHPEF